MRFLWSGEYGITSTSANRRSITQKDDLEHLLWPITIVTHRPAQTCRPSFDAGLVEITRRGLDPQRDEIRQPLRRAPLFSVGDKEMIKPSLLWFTLLAFTLATIALGSSEREGVLPGVRAPLRVSMAPAPLPANVPYPTKARMQFYLGGGV